MDATSLSENLQHSADQPDANRTGLWAWLQEKLDLAMYRPQAASGVVTSRLDGRDRALYRHQEHHGQDLLPDSATGTPSFGT